MVTLFGKERIMAFNTDWLPGKRADILEMAFNWSAVLDDKGDAWSIPAGQVSALDTLIATAQSALNATKGEGRGPEATAACKAAFAALVEKMRYIKDRYFFVPPLTDTDLISLGLKPRSGPSDTPPPENQATAKHRPLGDHLLELVLEIVGDLVKDAKASDYGFRIYWGIMPAGGASVDAAVGAKRELMKAPAGGEELPFSKFTRKKKEIFDFAEADRGKTVYFCIRLENAKGDPGPWGPLLNTVIP
jgi:hypothetical protein